MDSKMKRGRSVLRDLFIIICLFIPCVVVWLSNAVISLVWKVSAYVQSEWERFSDIYFDNTAVGKDVDPAFLVRIKGEDSLTGPCCCYHTPTSRKRKKRSKFRHHFLVIVNSVAHALLFVPEKIYTYVQRVSEDYHNIYGDSMVELPYTEPAFIAYLKGEEGAPFVKNPHIIFSKSDSRDTMDFARSNGIVERRKQHQGQNDKVTEGFSLVRLVFKSYCRIRSAVSALYWRCRHVTFCSQVNGEEHVQISQEIKHYSFNERKAHNYDKAANVNHSWQAEKLQEAVAAHHGTVPSSPAFAVGCGSDGRLFKCLSALRSPWNNAVNLRVQPNTGPKLWCSSLPSGAGKKQWNASPAVDKRAETQVKLFSESKANGEVMPPSTPSSMADSAGSSPVCTIKTEKKDEKRVTPFLFSLASVNTPAPTSPVIEKGKGKVMPRLILTSNVPVLPRVKAQDQEKASGFVRLNHVNFAKAGADSQTVVTHGYDTSSVREQFEVKCTVPRVMQAQSKEWCSEGKSRKNPLSADVHLRQTRTVKFCADSKAVTTRNHMISSDEKQTDAEFEVSGVKRAKNREGCREDTSIKNSSLGDVHTSEFCSADVSTEAEAILNHSHVTSSAEGGIEVEPKVSRIKRTNNKEFRGKTFRENASTSDARSCHFWFANVCADSQVSDFQTNEKTSNEEQIVEEPSVARTKRTRNEEECDHPRLWDAQACTNSTENPLNIRLGSNTRHAKREAESSSDVGSVSKETEFVSGKIHGVDVQNLAEQMELMKLVESPPERTLTELPEPMEIGGEENAKIFTFGELSDAKAPFSASFLVELESMETTQEESDIFFEKIRTEEMETGQASVFDECSFAWANVMQSLRVQPDEEMMETDQGSVTASPYVAQLGAITETLKEPFQVVMPFGQVGDSNLPVATGMGTSEATFAIPVQEELMETQELGDTYTPVETKLGDLADAKRPLASTVGMPKEETMLRNTPAAEEPVVQTVKEPVVQTVKEPVIETVKEPVMDTAKEPAMPPLKESTMPPPLVKIELQQSTQPSALLLSEHLQRMEAKRNNETGFVTIEHQQLVAVETDEIKSASQLAMERLQLVSEDPSVHDGLDSDSGSDDSSDDEYELDLATIAMFSELHTEPEHVELIMKLLTEKELASEQ